MKRFVEGEDRTQVTLLRDYAAREIQRQIEEGRRMDEEDADG